MVCLNKNLITKDLLTKIILLFQITIFVSPLFPLQFFSYIPFFWTYYPKKGVDNMQNSIHKQILFLFFLFLILIIVFSFVLHTPKDVPNSVSFYKLLLSYCRY